MFRGLCAYPITPADAEGRVDIEALGRLLTRLEQAGVDAVGLLGSTGTFAYLDRAERGRAIAAAVACLGGRTPVVVGIGALRTDTAVALARDAEAAGADGLLLAPVSYTPLLADEVFHHVRAVAGATALPLCLYNNPSTTRFTFDAALIERLGAEARIVALKTPARPPLELAAELADLRARVPAGFALGYSGDWHCAGALMAGADAWHSVAAGLFPEPALRLTRAAQTGDVDRVERLDAQLAPLWDLFEELSSLRVMYAAAAELGLSDLPPPRPLLPLAAADRERVARTLDALALR